MADPSTPAGRRRRRWPYLVGGIVLLIAVLIALLPTLVTWGLGQGMIRRSIAKSVNGDVHFARLKASWFGDQTVETLRVTYPNGQEAANLDVVVRSGLYQILTQRPGPIDVTISGTVNGEVREDGSTSFQELIPPKQPSPQPQLPSPQRPFNIADLPPVQVSIGGLNVHLKNARTQQTLSLQNLTGSFKYEEPAQPITVNLTGTTNANGTQGSLAINGLAENLFSEVGTLTLTGASARVEAKVESIPLPIPLPGIDAATVIQNAALSVISDDLTQRVVATAEVNAQIAGQPPAYAQVQASLSNVLSPRGELALKGGTANITMLAKNVPIHSQDLRGQLQQLRATVVSNDLTQTIVIAIDNQSQLEGQPLSVLAASLSVDELLSADGAVAQFHEIMEKTTGTIQGTTVPTVLVQPMLAATPVDAARDLGPVVDINASFSSGVSRQISVVVAGLTRFETQATVDTQTGAIRGNHLLFAAPRVHPDLVQALAQVAIDRPADFTLRLNSFVIPPGTPLSLQQVSASGTAALRGPMVLTLRDKPPLNVQAAQVHFESPGLGDHVQVEGSATIDDASVTFKQKITNLLNADGKPDPQNALPEGQIAVHNLRAATLVKFAPQQQAIIEQVVGPALSATIDTSVQDAYLSATVQATAAALNARSTVTRRADALHVASAHADVHLTPQLVATLQRDSANPIAISKPATASINVQSFDLPSTGGFAYALPSDPIRATVETQDIVIDKPPSLNEPLGIAGLVAEIALTLRDGGWKAEANGDVELRRPSNDQSIASARYRSEVFKQGESTAVTATIGMTGISVPNFEQMLGQKAREISQWTGDNGDMNVHVEFTGDTKKIVARPLLPNFHGEFTTIIDPQSLTITGETHEMKLARAALEARMNPASQKGAATAPTPTQADASETRVQVLDDVPVSMKLRQIRLPMKEKFDPATASIEAEITGGPMRLVNRSENGEVRTTLNDLRLTVNTSNLAEGVQFVLKSSAEATVPQPPAPDEQPANVRKPARVAAGGSRKAGTLEVSGTIDQLIDEQSQLNLAGAKLRMNAKASDVPTAVADALANLQGMLTAAVGPMMTATLKAQNFSLDSGRLEGRIETTNGHLESTILGRQHSLRINTENPLAAKLEITPPLRDRLLYKIHPIFADIRTTEQPLTATINWAQAGFKEDGTFDIADLNANIEITIGKVALDSGSTTLFLLKLFGQAEKRTTIPGEFEPIVAKIRKGIVNYDRFAVRIDKYTMVYSGQINLVNQTMNLRTELPLAALGQSIRELEPYADKIIVPIVTRGKFGEQKTQIDPDFDVGKEALKAGFGGTIENLLRDKGGLGGLFDQLNRDRK